AGRANALIVSPRRADPPSSRSASFKPRPISNRHAPHDSSGESGAQPREHAVEHCEGPSAIIEQIGTQHVSAIELAKIVRCAPVERNQRSAATTFDRGSITALVHHEVLERSQKKRTQPAFFLSHGLKIFAL